MKKYEIITYEASGRLFQLTENRIVFEEKTCEEYETLEEARAKFEKCDAEQRFDGLDIAGGKIYTARCHSLYEAEFDDKGELIDGYFMATNYPDLDLEWNGYEE